MHDVAIHLVHHSVPRLLRQTLKGIRRSKPSVSYEVIVVENNPDMPLSKELKQEFPEVRFFSTPQNLGFGGGMNFAMAHAHARYHFVFNPDLVVFEGVVESLVAYMDAHPDVGIAGPQLKHPDGSLQHSCYRFMQPSMVFYRRVPGLKRLALVRQAIGDYTMAEWDHQSNAPVDYLLGAAMLIRAEALHEVGGFDPGFFLYFEEQDLCRRFWKAGWRVMYVADCHLVHYHRRETAEGNFLQQLLHPLTRTQLKSAIYYFRKYRHEPNPRLHYVPRSRFSETPQTAATPVIPPSEMGR